MSQLIFKFPFKTTYFEKDFFVSANNFEAYKLIESWPNWSGKWLNVFGDTGSGKTHLTKILEKNLKNCKLIIDHDGAWKKYNLKNNYYLSGDRGWI